MSDTDIPVPDEKMALEVRASMIQAATDLVNAGLSLYQAKPYYKSTAGALREIALQSAYRVVLLNNLLDDATREHLAAMPIFMEPGVLTQMLEDHKTLQSLEQAAQ